MNEYDLFDAIGGVEDDLLHRSEQTAAIKIPFRKLLITAAAVMLLAVTAIAAPAIAELLFDSDTEQTIFGTTLTAQDGSEVTYDDIHMIHFGVDNPEELPTSIEEYHIPHYVEENGWTLDGGYLYSFDYGENTNIRWVNEGVPYQWIEFEQASINQFDEWLDQEPGTNQFYIASAPGTEVTQRTLSTSLGEIPVYLATNNPYTVRDYEGNRQMHVFWSNGTYAFHIMTSDAMDEEMLAQIIVSVAPVEDPAPYLVDNGRNGLDLITPDPVLENPMILNAIPEGFTLTKCDADEDRVNWMWFDDSGDYLNFAQHTGSHMDINLHQYTLGQIPHTLEEMPLDGSIVYFITAEDHVSAFWTGEGCEFGLVWATDETVTWEQVAELIRSLEPVDDISEYVTE